MFRFWGIFDIVSSDLCGILSNLRAVQSALPVHQKTNIPNVQNEGRGGVDGVLGNVKKNSIISREGHDDLSIHI